VLDSTNTKDSSSSSSSISMLTNTNVPPLSTSPSTILNSSRFSFFNRNRILSLVYVDDDDDDEKRDELRIVDGEVDNGGTFV
ncbi:unnamed protein product, partial [Rotaria sp. Silwood2]